MDELELRRRAIADPDDDSAEFRDLLARDSGAARTAANTRRLQQNLRATVQAVPVPDGLAERILLRRDMDSRRLQRPRWRQPRTLAMAASVLVMVVSAGWLGLGREQTIETEVLAHIRSEIAHLYEVNDIDPERLQAQVAHVGGSLSGDLGQVNFASLCPTAEGIGLHLVVQGRSGPVTVLYLPDTDAGKDVAIATRQFRGRALARGSGTLAIVGVPDEDIDTLIERVDAALRFPAVRVAAI